MVCNEVPGTYHALFSLHLCAEIGFAFLGMICTTFTNNNFHLVTDASSQDDERRSKRHGRGIFTVEF